MFLNQLSWLSGDPLFLSLFLSPHLILVAAASNHSGNVEN
jgi:hypothetical protein